MNQLVCDCFIGNIDRADRYAISASWEPGSYLKPLPDDKSLDWSKLKQIANNILR